MAFPERHALLAWGGSSPGGEIWNNTLRMKSSGVAFPVHDSFNTWLAGPVKDALATYWASISTLVGNGTSLKWAKLNSIKEDGKYIDDTTNLYTWGTPLVGAAGRTDAPQISIVVTTTTGLARGRAHIGRFFLPNVAVSVDSTTGTISSTLATNVAGWSKTFINALNAGCNVPGPGYALKAAVISRVGAGAVHDITGVRVGRTLDTQRRRRNKVAEAPVAVAL